MPTSARKQRGLAWWAMVAVVVLLAYSLSIGPAYKLFCSRRIGVSTFSTLYRPLIYLAGKSESSKRIYYGYLDLWEPWPDHIGPVPVVGEW